MLKCWNIPTVFAGVTKLRDSEKIYLNTTIFAKRLNRQQAGPRDIQMNLAPPSGTEHLPHSWPVSLAPLVVTITGPCQSTESAPTPAGDSFVCKSGKELAWTLSTNSHRVRFRSSDKWTFLDKHIISARKTVRIVPQSYPCILASQTFTLLNVNVFS